ncbi:MAG: hypothetical protein GOMPHAMPRED_006160 [Gomphillus americanus]|uniref:Zn(2)-C6 fungal-type domain-containing protein n=1 Tax=Gomphillus americanus TaxID=1940652 RepID=A0A8H3EM46_9LECA|nr:MAG: hypothetical protein GOMPHAMPRED_006160 [Gomphillus americanus]
MAIQDNKRPAARVGHRKSRTGCLKCRSRRVKCDETAPICANCQRLGLQCLYPSKPKSSMKSTDAPLTSNAEISKASIPERTIKSSSNSTNLPTPLSSEYEKDIPSTSSGSRMELRLLHAFMSRVVPTTTSILASSEWRQVWFTDMPRIAFDHDNLLYALLAFSATQVLGSPLGNSDVSLAQAEFFAIALQRQRAAISNPDYDIEATTLAAILIAQSAFGMLRGRVLEPYTPPADWFEVSRSAWRVFPRVKDIPPDCIVLRLLVETTAPIWQKWSREAGCYDFHVDEIYKPILTYLVPEEFDHYGGDRIKGLEAYEKTLDLLTNFRQALAGQDEPVQNNLFRVSLIAQTVPDDFVRFVREERPRALLITASILAVISRTKILRLYGDAGHTIPRSEIQAIRKILPEEWQGLMVQPLEELASSVG